MTDALSQDDLDLLGRIAAATLDPVEPPPGIRARILSTLHSVTIRAHEGRWLIAGPGVAPPSPTTARSWPPPKAARCS